MRFTLDSEWVAWVAKLGVQATGADGGGACGALINKLGSNNFYFASSPSSGSCYIQGKLNPPGFPGGAYSISCIYPRGTPPSSVTGTVQSKLTGLAPCEFSCPAGYKRYETTIYCQPIPCPISPLVRPTDPEALPFMNEPGRVVEDRLSPRMRDALNNLRVAVRNERGTLTVTSAWRPQSYQTYLFDVVQKNAAFNSNPNLTTQNPFCSPIKSEVQSEHRLRRLGTQAGATSPHNTGNAFDANWFGITEARIDALAGQFNLSRPIANDTVHFQFSN